jgi:hypothetical protein
MEKTPKTKYYKPVPDEEKKVSGRPKKYNRVLVVNEKTGKEDIVLTLIDKHRYFFVSYVYNHLNKNIYSSITFETSKNGMFNIKDIQEVTGITNIVILFWQEFIDKQDYEKFQNKQETPQMEVI